MTDVANCHQLSFVSSHLKQNLSCTVAAQNLEISYNNSADQLGRFCKALSRLLRDVHHQKFLCVVTTSFPVTSALMCLCKRVYIAFVVSTYFKAGIW